MTGTPSPTYAKTVHRRYLYVEKQQVRPQIADLYSSPGYGVNSAVMMAPPMDAITADTLSTWRESFEIQTVV